MAVKPIPDGYHSITPYLTLRDAPKIVAFLKQAFGAQIVFEPMRRPDGSIGHAELKIGESSINVTGEWPEGGRFSAETVGQSPISRHHIPVEPRYVWK